MAHKPISALPTKPPKGTVRAETDLETISLTESIAGLQHRLHAAGNDALLIILQGMDGSGKDGTVRKVFGPTNPAGVEVHAFGPPTPKEMAHDFLWRAHKVVPPRGKIGIFNRSYYEDVLVVRVYADSLLPGHLRKVKDPWTRRFEEIRTFERLLHQANTHVLKFFLHISKDEQKKRFLARQRDPEKQYKLQRSDIRDRANWDKFEKCYDEVIAATHSKECPWIIVPADDKWYRNHVVAKHVENVLRGINPRAPVLTDEELRTMLIE